MRPVVITQTGAGTSAAIPLDRYISPFSVAVFCHVVSAGTYKVQYTYDDVFTVASGSQNWIDDTTIGAGTAADAQTNYSVPISAVRLVVASGTVSITVNQAGHV
jgi:hypothetical protein